MSWAINRAIASGSATSVAPALWPLPCLTHHAACRAQQRAIPLHVLDLLLDYGDRTPAGDGAEIVRLTGRAWQQLKRDLPLATIHQHGRKLQSAYAVVAADGAVITVGHQFRRLERH